MKQDNNKVKRLEVRDSPCIRLDVPGATKYSVVERWRFAEQKCFLLPGNGARKYA